MSDPEKTVVARFYVSQIAQFAYAKDARQVTLNVVTQGEENKVWAAATPTGQIQMTIRNPLAADLFEIGAEYEIRVRRVQ